MKPLALAVAVALSFAAPLPAFAQAAAAPAATAAPAKPAPAWVEASNANAQILLEASAKFSPESASFFGVPGYDDKVADLKEGQLADVKVKIVETGALNGKTGAMLVKVERLSRDTIDGSCVS